MILHHYLTIIFTMLLLNSATAAQAHRKLRQGTKAKTRQHNNHKNNKDNHNKGSHSGHGSKGGSSSQGSKGGSSSQQYHTFTIQNQLPSVIKLLSLNTYPTAAGKQGTGKMYAGIFAVLW